MNNYIILDGNKYKTSSTNWVETEVSPRQVKRLLSSKGDVAFGIASYYTWRGTLLVPVVAVAGFGEKADLEATYRKHNILVMEDHFGVKRNVAISSGALEKQSFTAMWDGTENEFHIPVEIVTL